MLGRLSSFRSRLTYANVVSSIALFLALSTGAAFAANTIGSADVVNESLLSEDIKDGTVAGGDIASNAVTSVKIGTGGVANSDLASGSVTSDKVKDGAATTAKLADLAVTGAKIADGTIEASKLAPLLSLAFSQGSVISENTFGLEISKWLVVHGPLLAYDSVQTPELTADRIRVDGGCPGYRLQGFVGRLEVVRYDCGDQTTPAAKFSSDNDLKTGTFFNDNSTTCTEWSNLSGNSTLAYQRDPIFRVQLQGVVKGGSLGTSATGCKITVLPEGYRPAVKRIFTVWSSNASGVGRVTVFPTGEVTASAPASNAGVSLDGVSFPAVVQ